MENVIIAAIVVGGLFLAVVVITIAVAIDYERDRRLNLNKAHLELQTKQTESLDQVRLAELELERLKVSRGL